VLGRAVFSHQRAADEYRHDNTPLADACKFRHRRAVALLVAAGARLGLRPLRLAGILCALVKARCSRDHGRSREV